MSYESNSGSVYYAISCGVPSASGVNVQSNSGTNYYYMSANDYILYGQPAHYTHVQSNSGSTYYFYQCNVASDAGLDLESNSGTHYYYNSAFNCVTFCD